MARTPKLIKDEIILEAENLARGESIRVKCFNCSGGSSGEETLSITLSEDGELYWICFRDGCSIKGSSISKTVQVANAAAKKMLKFDSFAALRKTVMPAPPVEISDLAMEKYKINLREYYVRWTTLHSPQATGPDEVQLGRCVFPIFDLHYNVVGYDLKDLLKQQQPKSKIIKDPEYKGPAWVMNHNGSNALVIVEDMISAIAVCDAGYDAVALLGTNLSTEAEEAIADHGAYDEIFIALDADALSKAINIIRTSSLSLKLIPLSKDIKDMSVKDREELLNEYCNEGESKC